MLVIAKSNRLARSVAFSNLMASGMEFAPADMPQANCLRLHILAAVAEHEQEMVAQRKEAALATTRTREASLCNPRLDMAAARAVASGNAARFRAAVKPQIQVLRAKVRSPQGIAAEPNAGGITGPRSGSWHSLSVQAVLHG